MAGEVEWARLRAEELRARVQAGAAVIVPVAAMEQHGPHLPVATDTLLTGEVARRAAAKAPPAVAAPVVWTGISEHHMEFGGTLSLDFATFHAVVAGVIRSLARHGFRRVLILNGHGGNAAAVRVIADELAPALGIAIAAATYWHLAAAEIAAILEAQTGALHACEAETSMVMALAPDLVRLDRLAPGPRALKGPEVAALVGPSLHRWRAIAARSADGVIGEPRAASAEKGERLFEAVAEVVAAVLRHEAFWALPDR